MAVRKPSTLLLAFLVVTISCARMSHAAGAAPYDCAIGFPGATTTDPAIADLLKSVGDGGAVRACQTQSRGVAYAILSKIRKSDRVHYYYEKEYFLRSNKPSLEWTPYPPKDSFLGKLGMRVVEATLYMCAEEHGCDDFNATGFVPTSGISTYLFRKFQDAWNRISKSKRLLTDAVDRSVNLEEDPAFRSAEEFIFSRPRSDVKVWSVGYSEVAEAFGSPPGFEFWIGTPRGTFWIFNFDYHETGIRILGVAQGIE